MKNKYAYLYSLLKEVATKEGISPADAKAMAKKDWGIESISDIEDVSIYEQELYDFVWYDLPLRPKITKHPIWVGQKTDSYGNYLKITPTVYGVYRIRLYLSEIKKGVHIGHYNMHLDKLEVFRSSSKHLHREKQAYGFNWEVIQMLPDNSKIEVQEDRIVCLYTTAQAIKEKGEFLFFRGQGFEKQIFLKRALFRK